MGLIIRPDCADLPYFLRAYFAFKMGLPFGFSKCSRGGGGRPPYCPQWFSIQNAEEARPPPPTPVAGTATGAPTPATAPLPHPRNIATSANTPSVSERLIQVRANGQSDGARVTAKSSILEHSRFPWRGRAAPDAPLPPARGHCGSTLPRRRRQEAARPLPAPPPPRPQLPDAAPDRPAPSPAPLR